MIIIAVDDEKHVLKDLAECLSSLRPNAEVTTFDRGDKALKYAREHMVDVAFLDVQMPVMDGIELAKQLKQIRPLIIVVFCTAYNHYTRAAIRLHASGYVTKPYEKADIARELDNLLHPVAATMPAVFARTFGDFDLFVDGVAVTFGRAKSKELLAYLISKQGGVVTRKEIAAVLFGDEYSAKTQNYLVKIYTDLVKTLKAVGADDILIKNYNQYSIDVRKLACDYFDYNAGDPAAINSYHGDFMGQYDWGVL